MSAGPIIEALGAQPNGEKYIAAWESNLSHFEQIDQTTLRGLINVDRVASQIFTEDESFEDLRQVLGSSEEAQNLAIRAITTHNFPPESDYSQDVYDGLLLASHVREQLSRAYILHLLKEGATFGLNEWERDVLAVSCQVGGLYDQMCDRWRNEVARSPANERAAELGLTNPYTVIMERLSDGDGFEEVPWWNAFPEQAHGIADAWHELSTRLLDSEPETEKHAMGEFLRVYVGALSSTDVENLSELWRNVDRSWMKVTGRVQPIPSREYDYYDKNKFRVFPDFRLSIVVDESLYAACQATQRAQINHLTNAFPDSKVLKQTIEGMSRVQLMPDTYDIMFAGSLDFQPAGQSLPNEEIVRQEEGTKVFLNKHSMEERWEVALEAAHKTFPDDIELFEEVDVGFDGLAIMTAGHEYGEPLFNTDEVTEALGPAVVSMLNEDLATQTITAIMPLWLRDGSNDINRKDMERHAMYLLGNYLRYIALARGTEHLRPYYEGMGLLGLKRMIESRFIYQDEDHAWHIARNRMDEFYELSMRDLVTQVNIAENGDQMLAASYLVPAEHMEKLPMMSDLITKITGK